jgi:general stress protein YciG
MPTRTRNRGYDERSGRDRDERGRFASAENEGRGWQSEEEDYQPSRGQSSGRRGFAAMDPERRHQIAAEGGRSSHGSRGGHYEEENYESPRSRRRYEDEDEGYYESRGSSRRGFGSMDPERQREIASEGGRSSRRGQEHQYEDEEYESPRGGNRYEDEDEDYAQSRGNSRRGFAAMDPERRREIASRGGHSSHGGPGRHYEEQGESYGSSRGAGRRGFAAMDPEERRAIASRGGRSRWDE